MNCNTYLPSIKLDLSSGAYLDTGIVFPFFLKDCPSLDVARWVNDVNAIIANNSIFTTPLVLLEIKEALFHVPVPKGQRPVVKKLAKKIIAGMKMAGGAVKETDEVLSKADISLLRRKDPSKLLVTSDRALFSRDANAVLIIWDQDKQELGSIQK